MFLGNLFSKGETIFIQYRNYLLSMTEYDSVL